MNIISETDEKIIKDIYLREIIPGSLMFGETYEVSKTFIYELACALTGLTGNFGRHYLYMASWIYVNIVNYLRKSAPDDDRIYKEILAHKDYKNEDVYKLTREHVDMSYKTGEFFDEEGFMYCGHDVLMELFNTTMQYVYMHEMILPDGEIKFSDSVKFYFENNRENNKSVEFSEYYSTDWGQSFEKPVFTAGMKGAAGYLAELRFDSSGGFGQVKDIRRTDSRTVAGIGGDVDEYYIYEDGREIDRLYICIFGSRNPGKAPAGYTLKKK